MKTRILSDKTISPLAKLFLNELESWPTYITFDLTSAQIAKKFGVTGKQAKQMLDELSGLELIETKAVAPIRKTKLSTKYLTLSE